MFNSEICLIAGNLCKYITYNHNFLRCGGVAFILLVFTAVFYIIAKFFVKDVEASLKEPLSV